LLAKDAIGCLIIKKPIVDSLFACRRCNGVSNNNKNPLWTLFSLAEDAIRCLIIKTRDPKLGNIKSQGGGGGGGGKGTTTHTTQSSYNYN